MPAPLTLNTPGRWGVNEQERNQLLHPNWATVADGLVINEAGNLQCRGALNLISTDGAPAEILRQFVYVNSAGTEIVISTTATKIISGIADLDDSGTDITPTGAPTNGYWQFQNFNGKVVGWQAGHTPIVWSGSGDFAVITAASGTLPDGDCVLAAFGRLWAVDDDGQTVRYCALLDETLWHADDGGGAIDMRNVWPKGMDRVVALAAFGGNLVIFGRRSIVIYTDGSGSQLGVDPEQMYVVDTIEGTGCVSRDSVTIIGEGDLIFLAEIGLQSLGRVLASKDNPLDTISWQIGDRLAAAIKTEVASATDLRTWTGHYIPATKQYMLTHTTNEDVFVFHVSGRSQDEKGRWLIPITIWDTSILTNIRGFITLRTGVTYTTGSSTHELYQYDTSLSLDEGDVAIAVRYESGWLDLGDQNKLLKMAQITALNPGGIDSAITLRYAADYTTDIDTLTPVHTADDERVIFLYDPSGDIEGQYFKLGMSDTSFGRKTLTQVMAQFKKGRTAFVHKKFNDVTEEDEEFTELDPGIYTESFTATGSDTWIAPPGVVEVDVLIVAGGGGGGGFWGGGGGGGGVIYEQGVAVVPFTEYPIVIGAGGATRPFAQVGNGHDGDDSSAFGFTAIGGGGGGWTDPPDPDGDGATAGSPGGSGGGAGGTWLEVVAAAGGAGTVGQGNNGGTSGPTSIGAQFRSTGGGGGAGAVGANAANGQGGAGGAGISNSITGSAVFYGGGGGGGSGNAVSPSAGGSGGGGAGGVSNDFGGVLAQPVNGTANTGGGGGGTATDSVTSGAGGSGIVIIRYEVT